MYLSEVSRRTGLHPSTVFRILETLKQRGYVEYDENTGLYLMGVKAFELGNSYLVERPLSEFASQAMRHLAGELNETVNLAVQDGSEIVYIKQEESSHTFRMFTKVGARAPLYCTAIGKVILAWQDADLIKSLLGDEPYPAFTSKTLTSFYSFMEEVRRVPVSNFAWDNEEREEGVRCMAAPIHSAEGMAVAAISVSGPTNRFTLSVARQGIPPPY
jgi:IclR family acetate operon transcriptional repressor